MTAFSHRIQYFPQDSALVLIAIHWYPRKVAIGQEMLGLCQFAIESSLCYSLKAGNEQWSFLVARV